MDGNATRPFWDTPAARALNRRIRPMIDALPVVDYVAMGLILPDGEDWIWNRPNYEYSMVIDGAVDEDSANIGPKDTPDDGEDVPLSERGFGV